MLEKAAETQTAATKLHHVLAQCARSVDWHTTQVGPFVLEDGQVEFIREHLLARQHGAVAVVADGRDGSDELALHCVNRTLHFPCLVNADHEDDHLVAHAPCSW